MTTRTLLRLAAFAALSLTASFATAASIPAPTVQSSSKWTARVRATYLAMADKSDAFSALGINFGADAVSVNSKLIPEVDFSYGFTENFRAELVLTIPQKQKVSLAGVGGLGTFKHLPPVLAAQYHFNPRGTVQPYVGLGANFTLIFDTDLKVANVPLELENSSLGVAIQAGCDFALGNGMYLNVDVKNARLRSDVSVKGGPRLTTAKLDPWILSVGLGWTF